MGDDNVKVILVELNHIKEDVSEIKDELKHRCDTCMNIPIVKEQLKFHWVNIIALWSSVVGLGAYFYNHVAGGK